MTEKTSNSALTKKLSGSFNYSFPDVVPITTSSKANASFSLTESSRENTSTDGYEVLQSSDYRSQPLLKSCSKNSSTSAAPNYSKDSFEMLDMPEPKQKRRKLIRWKRIKSEDALEPSKAVPAAEEAESASSNESSSDDVASPKLIRKSNKKIKTVNSSLPCATKRPITSISYDELRRSRRLKIRPNAKKKREVFMLSNCDLTKLGHIERRKFGTNIYSRYKYNKVRNNLQGHKNPKVKGNVNSRQYFRNRDARREEQNRYAVEKSQTKCTEDAKSKARSIHWDLTLDSADEEEGKFRTASPGGTPWPAWYGVWGATADNPPRGLPFGSSYIPPLKETVEGNVLMRPRRYTDVPR